jgi:hypothetical protein
VGQAYYQATQGKQVEGVHQGERINVQVWNRTSLRSMICWLRHWRLILYQLRSQRLISFDHIKNRRTEPDGSV